MFKGAQTPPSQTLTSECKRERLTIPEGSLLRSTRTINKQQPDGFNANKTSNESGAPILLSSSSQEKRKRQTEIEDKRSQLDELVLQLQHLKVGGSCVVDRVGQKVFGSRPPEGGGEAAPGSFQL